MWPTLFQFDTAMGPYPINTYGLFMMAAFSAAFALIHLRAPLAGVQSDRLVAGYVAAAVGGMLGARLLYAVSVDWDRTISDPMSLLSCSGFAVYGGIIGGALGVLAFAVVSQLPLWTLADLAMPGLLMGMGFGRIGCFFAGCCHGAIAPIGENPIGLLPSAFTGGQLWLSSKAPFLTNEVHGGVGRLHDIPLYPTQMWSATVLLGIAGGLAWLWSRRRFDGQITAIALMIEPPTRAFIEAFRADPRGYVISWSVSDRVAAMIPGMAQAGDSVAGNVMGITTSQGIAILLVVLGVVIYAARRNGAVTVVKARTPADDADLLEELA